MNQISKRIVGIKTNYNKPVCLFSLSKLSLYICNLYKFHTQRKHFSNMKEKVEYNLLFGFSKLIFFILVRILIHHYRVSISTIYFTQGWVRLNRRLLRFLVFLGRNRIRCHISQHRNPWHSMDVISLRKPFTQTCQVEAQSFLLGKTSLVKRFLQVATESDTEVDQKNIVAKKSIF